MAVLAEDTALTELISLDLLLKGALHKLKRLSPYLMQSPDGQKIAAARKSIEWITARAERFGHEHWPDRSEYVCAMIRAAEDLAAEWAEDVRNAYGPQYGSGRRDRLDGGPGGRAVPRPGPNERKGTEWQP